MKSLDPVLQPHARDRLREGIRQMIEPVRLTLGPLPKGVVCTQEFPGQPLEFLDRGSVVARRIIQLQDRDADMGAMLVRDMLWRVHKLAGDSTATAAVIFDAIFETGFRHLVSGGDPMRLRQFIHEGGGVILDELDALTSRIDGEAQFVHAAAALGQDSDLAPPLGAIFHLLGEDAQIDIRGGHGRGTTWEYIDGAYWTGGALASELITGRRVELADPAILLSDLSLTDPFEIAKAIEAALLAGKRSLLVFAERIAPEVTGFLVANRDRTGFVTLAVKAPDQYRDRIGMLNDLALLVGGRVFISATGDMLRGIRPEHLGGARQAWADRDFVGIAHGQGNAAARRARIHALRTQIAAADDLERRSRLRAHLGKLMGGSAILWIGGSSRSEIEQRKLTAAQVIETLRGVCQQGVIAGGGTALLRCEGALRRWADQCADTDQRAAFRCLAAALEAPARTILANAGLPDGEILNAIRRSKPGMGCDAVRQQMVDMVQMGIVDSAAAYKTAFTVAAQAAATALTIDVLIHRRNPPMVIEPGASS
jgi:chaperonin GroEL